MKHLKSMTEADIELVAEYKDSLLSFPQFCELHGLALPRFRAVVAAVNRFKLIEQLAKEKTCLQKDARSSFAEVFVAKRIEEPTVCCVLHSKNSELHFSKLPPANWVAELFRALP